MPSISPLIKDKQRKRTHSCIFSSPLFTSYWCCCCCCCGCSLFLLRSCSATRASTIWTSLEYAFYANEVFADKDARVFRHRASMCIYACVCIYIRLCICAYKYVCVCVCVNSKATSHTCEAIAECLQLFACARVCVCLCVRICLCVFTYRLVCFLCFICTIVQNSTEHSNNCYFHLHCFASTLPPPPPAHQWPLYIHAFVCNRALLRSWAQANQRQCCSNARCTI